METERERIKAIDRNEKAKTTKAKWTPQAEKKPCVRAAITCMARPGEGGKVQGGRSRESALPCRDKA